MGELQDGSIVLLHALDDYPEHHFEIWEVYDDCVTGYSLDGPLIGVYGEPDRALIKAVVRY
jgi:hypothetical protein